MTVYVALSFVELHFMYVDIASENWVDPRGYIEFLLDNREKLPFEDLLPWSGKIPESIKIPRKSRPV
jgi:hypothetical protein